MKFKYSSSWTTSLLDDVTDRGSGHTPSQSSPEYWNGQIKWVSLADSSKLDNLFISNTDKTISELGIKNSSAVKHPAGTVILSRDAGVGKSAILKEEMAVSQHFIAWKCSSKNIIHNIYLYYWLQMMKHEFERMAVGSTIKTIGLPYFKKLEITYPPLLEQCRIAEVLGVWDESIDLLERLIGRVRSRKQGLMQQLLTGKKRFKEFEGSDWKSYKLKDIGKVVSGGTPDTNNPEYWNGNIPWCTPSEITALKDRYIKFTSRTISNEGIKSSSTAIIPPNSLLVCTRATLGYSAINIVPMCTNQGFKSLIPNNIVSVEFLYYKLHLEKCQLLRLASGSTFLEISKKDFEMIEIKIPPLPEQEKIAAVLSAADEEISTLEKQLAAYKQQKLGLMQQLLTGKIRVGMI